tara:strand:+ start:29818 stop:30339 length:522 start_codon:yes stop_codon:yes gene_type:complete
MQKSTASRRSKKSIVQQSQTEGRGLFAREPIAAGEIVSVRGGHIIHRSEEGGLSKPNGYWGYPISEDFVLAPLTEQEVEDTMMFLNHSCEPNVGIQGQVLFVAMGDIERGEELCIDYAMFGGIEEPMHCRCGFPLCRGQVSASDWQDKSLQARYKGFFSSFVQWKIDAKENSA